MSIIHNIKTVTSHEMGSCTNWMNEIIQALAALLIGKSGFTSKGGGEGRERFVSAAPVL